MGRLCQGKRIVDHNSFFVSNGEGEAMNGVSEIREHEEIVDDGEDEIIDDDEVELDMAELLSDDSDEERDAFSEDEMGMASEPVFEDAYASDEFDNL